MVNTLSRMDGSPGTEQIATWLDHLADEEVLKRMSRLKPTHTYEPDIVLSNFEVLSAMRDEAVAFGADEAPVR
jgi:hypothetical protein